MIVPSIDLMNRNAVQLIGGREKAIDAGDPMPIAESFRLAGEIAVIDLDAALSQGSNESVIRELLALAPCRVGGGIRSASDAIRWLDAGASKVILGTAATPEVLRELPRERTIAALDTSHGEVVVEGWLRATGRTVIDRMRELRDIVGGFLVTFVDREGRMGGIDLTEVEVLVNEAHDARLTVAGGVTTADEVAAIDALGADCQVGMALYTGRLGLAEAITAPLTSDRPDGLWPTVVVDERGVALGLAYSNAESVRHAVEQRRGVYHSRSRGLWVKGESSGSTQELLAIDLDCDRDTLRFTVRQKGEGFCHRHTRTCWGADAGLSALERTLRDRLRQAPPDSYTARLCRDPSLLHAKLREEVEELIHSQTSEETAQEAADVLYFTLVAMTNSGVSLEQVETILNQRRRRLTRRPGDAKPTRERGGA